MKCVRRLCKLFHIRTKLTAYFGSSAFDIPDRKNIWQLMEFPDLRNKLLLLNSLWVFISNFVKLRFSFC